MNKAIVWYITRNEYDFLSLSVKQMQSYDWVDMIVILHTDEKRPRYYDDLGEEYQKVLENWEYYGTGFDKPIEEGGFDEVAARNSAIRFAEVVAEGYGAGWLLQCDSDEFYTYETGSLMQTESIKNIMCWVPTGYVTTIAENNHKRLWPASYRLRYKQNPNDNIFTGSYNGLPIRNRSVHCVVDTKDYKIDLYEKEFYHVHMRKPLKGRGWDFTGLPMPDLVPDIYKNYIENHRPRQVFMGELAYVLKQRFPGFDPKFIIDCGCNSGADTIKFHELYPDAYVLGIEGSRKIYEKNKLYEKDIDNRVRFLCTGISDKVERKPFYIVNTNDMQSGIKSQNFQNTTTELVECTTLEAICDEYGEKIDLTSIDILKIDIEGCSYEALKGLGDYIYLTKVIHIETEEQEYFRDQILAPEVRKYLTEKGFVCILERQCYPDCRQFDEVWINRRLMMKPKMLVIGTGRCGTGYISQIFNKLGITATHEGIFNPDTLQDGNIPDWPETVVVGCSWLATFHVEAIKNKYPELIVIHLTRDPIRTIKSFMQINFFDQNNKYYNWAQQQPKFPSQILQNTPLEQAARWWNTLSSWARENCCHEIRIEDVDQTTILGLCELLKLKVSKKAIKEALRDVPKDFNNASHRKNRYELCLGDIPEPYRTRLVEHSKQFGYEL